MRRGPVRRCVPWLAALLLAAAAHGDTLRIALLGDIPYTARERALLPRMFEAMAVAGATLAIHVGDFKSGHEPCSEALYADRLALFAASPLPLVLVPGDNDWTDCHRLSNGGHDPLERLARVRRVFFAEARSLGTPSIAVERQSAIFPEHQRWRTGPVQFIGLNVPGGDNNWGYRQTPTAEYSNRMPHVLAWLHQGFAQARDGGARVVVIAFQANPDFRGFSVGVGGRGYRELLEALRDETMRFDGEVVVVHGDTHWFRVDHPLRDPTSGRALPNFTRVEVYGSPFMGWAMLDIDLDAPRRLRIAPTTYPPGDAG